MGHGKGRPARPAAQGMRRVRFRGGPCCAGPRSRPEKARPAPASEACRTPRAGTAGLLSAPCRPSRMGCRRAPPAGVAGALRMHFRRGQEPRHGRTAPAYLGALRASRARACDPRPPACLRSARSCSDTGSGRTGRRGRRPIMPIGLLSAPAFLRGASCGRTWGACTERGGGGHVRQYLRDPVQTPTGRRAGARRWE